MVGVDAGLVVDPRQRSLAEPHILLRIPRLIPFEQQLAVGAVVEDRGKPVLVDLPDAFAQGVVGVGGGLRRRLGGGQAVEPVVGEGGGADALGIAVGGLVARGAAGLEQAVAAGGAVDVGQGAGVAGFT